ncbi:hypothetical protein NDU88_004652, partial [Pleurodeles waltl]
RSHASGICPANRHQRASSGEDYSDTFAIQGMANSGTCHSLPLMDLGNIRSEHELLGLHVSTEVKEKIWK